MKEAEMLLYDLQAISQDEYADEKTIETYKLIQETKNIFDLLHIPVDTLNEVKELAVRIYNEQSINTSFMYLIKNMNAVPADIDYI